MEKNILVVGCGGIGCELLKLLMLKGIKHVTIVDNDTIEVTNLNRQFFFTRSNVGKFKTDITKQYYEQMVRDARVISYNESIINERFDLKFFETFEIVYNCLDNVEARSYVSLRCRLARVPLVDGGSARYLGQSMVFFENECYDCTPKIQEQSFPICTIRGRPQSFVHCVAYAKEVFYANIRKKRARYKELENVCRFLFGSRECDSSKTKIAKKIMKYHARLKRSNFPVFNKDNRNINKFIYYVAQARASNYGITVENFFTAEKIVKNIIPSICTTNAAVASLMLISAAGLTHNYFLTKNKKLIIKNYPGISSSTCGICGVKWFVLYLNNNVLMMSDFLEKIGLESAIFVINNRFYDSQRDINELIVSHNSIMVVKSGCELFKFYINVDHRYIFDNEEFTLS